MTVLTYRLFLTFVGGNGGWPFPGKGDEVVFTEKADRNLDAGRPEGDLDSAVAPETFMEVCFPSGVEAWPFLTTDIFGTTTGSSDMGTFVGI